MYFRYSQLLTEKRSLEQLAGAQLSVSRDLKNIIVEELIVEVWDQLNLAYTSEPMIFDPEEKHWTPVVIQEQSDQMLYNKTEARLFCFIDMFKIIFDKCVVTSSLIKKLVMTCIDKNKTQPAPVIQFADCYLSGKQFIPGFFTIHPPKIQLPWEVFQHLRSDSIDDNQPLKEFLTHIAGSEESLPVFLDRLSQVFVTDPALKKEFGTGIILYGPEGGEGKSAFFMIESKMLGKDNVSFGAIDEIAGYRAGEILNNFVFYDDDINLSGTDAKASSLLKKIVTGSPVVTRMIYSKPKEIEPGVAVRVATNGEITLTENEKDPGIRRRFLIVHPSGQLEWRDDFNALLEDDALETLCRIYCQFLYRRFQRGENLPLGNRELHLEKRFFVKADSVADFVVQRGRDLIHLWTIKEIYDYYLEWCDENIEPPKPPRSFTKSMEKQGFIKKSIPADSARGLFSDAAMSARRKTLPAWIDIFAKGKNK